MLWLQLLRCEHILVSFILWRQEAEYIEVVDETRHVGTSRALGNFIDQTTNWLIDSNNKWNKCEPVNSQQDTKQSLPFEQQSAPSKLQYLSVDASFPSQTVFKRPR